MRRGGAQLSAWSARSWWEVPDARQSVGAGGDDAGSIGAEDGPQDIAFVTEGTGKRETGLGIPDAGGIVEGASDNPQTVRAKTGGTDEAIVFD